MGSNFSDRRKNKLGVPVSKQAANLCKTWEETNSNEDLKRLLDLKKKHNLSWNQLGLGKKRISILNAKASMDISKT